MIHPCLVKGIWEFCRFYGILYKNWQCWSNVIIPTSDTVLEESSSMPALQWALASVIITLLNNSKLNKNGCAQYPTNQSPPLVGNQSETPSYLQFKLFHFIYQHNETYILIPKIESEILHALLDFQLKKVLLPPPLGNFADISYLEENFKPHLLRDVCTLCSGALVSDSLLHMLL